MNFTVSTPKATKSFGQNEKAADRLVRMRQFWQSKDNAILYVLGMFLSILVAKGKRIADLLAEGGEVVVDSLTLPNGTVLPVNPPQTISLATLADKVHGWGCPACHSAHGSGIYPSREVVADQLARNKWYYNPATRQMFVISDTCLGIYCEDLGALGRIKPVPTKVQAPVTPAPATAPAK